MKNTSILQLCISILMFGILITSSLSIGRSIESNQSIFNEKNTLIESLESQPYEGFLRIYITEPISRWNNYDGEPYKFGFLDFAYNDQLSIPYQDTFTQTIQWNAADAGYPDIEEDNIMAIVVLMNPVINPGYSKPPMANIFEAHYIDATIGLEPGDTKSDTPGKEYTHTVFLEEATATWCPYCPAMANAIHSIYESGEYPFYYISLISDKNDVIFDYLYTIYNLYAYPSAFFDGGRKVLVGGYDEEDKFTSKIDYSGVKPVHDLEVSASLHWTDPGVLDIEVEITNNEDIQNSPPESPTIEGPAEGKYNEEQTYTFSGTDPDSNNLYYYIDWGDGSDIAKYGPYGSGRSISKSHTWLEQGSYTIQVKSKDIYNKETDWVSLEVSMPKAKSSNLSLFLQEHFTIFHQLQTLLDLI